MSREQYGWIVWFIAALFFFAAYVSRVAPGVIINDIMRDWHIKATMVGSVAGFFYYAYILMQVPVGLILDKGNPVKVLIMSLSLCVIGNLLFSMTNHVFIGQLARVLIGAGSAFAFAGSIKIAVIWFKGEHLGVVSGLTQTMGMLGAAVGEWGIAALNSSFHWREVMGMVTILLGVVLLLMFVFLRMPKDHKCEQSKEVNWRHILTMVMGNKQTWINGCYAALIFLPTLVFGESWGPIYLEKVRGLSHASASMVCSMIFVGWVIGGVFIGAFSDYIGRRRPVLMGSAVVSFVMMTVALYVHDVSQTALIVIMVLYGIANTGLVASYAVAGEINPQIATGLSMATVNMLSIILGAAMLPVIGLVLDFGWQGQMHQGVPVYDAASYEKAMLLLPFSLVMAFVLAFFVQETHCKPYEESHGK